MTNKAQLRSQADKLKQQLYSELKEKIERRIVPIRKAWSDETMWRQSGRNEALEEVIKLLE